MTQASPFALAADLLDPPEPEHAGDPQRFVVEVLDDFLWSKQVEILDSVWIHPRTAVPSCFGSGKSFTAARAAAAWIATHPLGEAFVVTTATTYRQVKAILWRELRRAHRKGNLPGRLNQTEWYIPIAGDEEIVAFGLKPADHAPDAFTGIHARYVLVIIDEADGVSQALFDAAEGLIVNPDSRILAIGNLWDPTGPFAEACKPGSGWKVIRIAAGDTPNFTGEKVPESLRALLISREWVEDKKKRWGTKDPRYVSKVLALVPEDVEGTLIHLIWAEEAQKRTLKKTLPIELGVDVGGDAGGDETVIAVRHGDWVRVVFATRSLDTSDVAGHVVRMAAEVGATVVKIDSVGIGKGVYDLVKRNIRKGVGVIPVNNGSAPHDPDFATLGDELAWGVRDRFKDGEIDIDPDDDELVSQCVKRRWGTTPKGKIKLEAKDEVRRRGLPSPDRFDAVVLACAPLAHHPRAQTDEDRIRELRARERSVFGRIMDEGEVGF